MKNEFDYLNDVRVDFSKYEIIDLTEQERINMKKELKEKTHRKISWKKCAVIAACVASLAIVSQTAFAQNLVSGIIKSISTGHNTFVQTENTEQEQPKTFPIPKQLEGQIYDKDGNMLTEMSSDISKIYDKDGNEVKIAAKMSEGDAEPEISLTRVMGPDEIPESDEDCIIYTSLDDVKDILNFSPKVPEYLPEGYNLLYVKAFRKESNSDNISGDYLMLSYSNGTKKFSISERIINDNTRFTTDGDYTEGEINGHTAAIANYEIHWEADGISVSLLGSDAVAGDELINVAQSIK